jgi:hypothetical protein
LIFVKKYIYIIIYLSYIPVGPRPKTKSRLVIAVAPAALRCAVRLAKALVTCATRRNGDLEDLEDLGDLPEMSLGHDGCGKWRFIAVKTIGKP